MKFFPLDMAIIKFAAALEERNKKLNEMKLMMEREREKINYPIRMLLLWWALQFSEMGNIILSDNGNIFWGNLSDISLECSFCERLLINDDY